MTTLNLSAMSPAESALLAALLACENARLQLVALAEIADMASRPDDDEDEGCEQDLTTALIGTEWTLRTLASVAEGTASKPVVRALRKLSGESALILPWPSADLLDQCEEALKVGA